MLRDLNKNIGTSSADGIIYNHLNLPTQVTIGGQNINYTYDAAGMKLKKVVNGITTEYARNYIYENNVLQFFNHPEGYVKPVFANGSAAISSFDYVYQYKDHLGNVRLSYTDNNNDGVIQTDGTNSEIVEESNYYPFGLKHKGYNTIKNIGIGNASAQKFGYNGKELNEELGIQWMDFGARNYDAALGRWMNIDPKAEEMRRWSPYNVSFNNPLRFIDPDGMKPEDIIVLLNRKSAKGYGHMAILIGDNDKGWTYISKNGRAYNKDGNKEGTMLAGGKSSVTEMNFKNLEEALSVLNVSYEEGIRFETSNKEDDKAKKVAKESAKEDYHITNNNCGDIVTKALEKVGINGGKKINERYGEYVTDQRPNVRFEDIKKNKEKKVSIPNNKEMDNE